MQSRYDWRMNFHINRRRFLQTSAASLAVSTLGSFGADLANQKPRRVGLIGCGWYGKNDVCRLIQVAPVEVILLIDVIMPGPQHVGRLLERGGPGSRGAAGTA